MPPAFVFLNVDPDFLAAVILDPPVWRSHERFNFIAGGAFWDYQANIGGKMP